MIFVHNGYNTFGNDPGMVTVWKGTEEEVQEAADDYRKRTEEEETPSVIYFYSDFNGWADLKDVVRPISDYELEVSHGA